MFSVPVQHPHPLLDSLLLGLQNLSGTIHRHDEMDTKRLNEMLWRGPALARCDDKPHSTVEEHCVKVDSHSSFMCSLFSQSVKVLFWILKCRFGNV